MKPLNEKARCWLLNSTNVAAAQQAQAGAEGAQARNAGDESSTEKAMEKNKRASPVDYFYPELENVKRGAE